MWNYQVTLVKPIYEANEFGQLIEIGNEFVKLLCKKKSVKGVEFYAARQANISPELIIVVKRFEYDDQSKIIFEDKVFDLIRTYEIGYEDLELVCKRGVNNV